MEHGVVIRCGTLVYLALLVISVTTTAIPAHQMESCHMMELSSMELQWVSSVLQVSTAQQGPQMVQIVQ
jgi:hypothetical protein